MGDNHIQKLGGEIMAIIRFNNIDNPDWMEITNITDRVLPLLEVSSVNIRGRAGVTRGSKDLGTREIIVTFNIDADTEQQMRERARWLANEFLYTDGPAEFYQYRNPDVYYLAEVSTGGELREESILGTRANLQVVFTCYNSLALSVDTTRHTWATVSGVGATFTNNGYTTFPTITFRVTSALTEIRLSMNGQEMLLQGAGLVSNGDIIVIDSEAGTITRNGVRFINRLTPSSRFPIIRKGLNNLSITQSTITDINITYQERWL